MSEKSPNDAPIRDQSHSLDPYRQTVDQALTALGSDSRLGLGEAEARTRLERHGRNELAAETPVPAWRKVAALREMSAAQANVIRGGERTSIAAAEVVPGDIILLEEGDTVPADGRLIQSTALQTAEAALTGESLPVSKHIEPIGEEVGVGDRHNMVWSGTSATYGRGTAVVIATAMHTQIGGSRRSRGGHGSGLRG